MIRHSKPIVLPKIQTIFFFKNGLAEGLPRIAELLLNAVIVVKRSAHIGAIPIERSAQNSLAGLNQWGLQAGHLRVHFIT